MKNPEGQVVFTDGPRWVANLRDPYFRELTTSMTTTWTELEYRGFGIYQHALLHYMKRLKLKRTYLYTENEETLEFIYRLKNILYSSEESRLKLLSIPGMADYLTEMGVPVERVHSGHLRYVKMAEKAIGYLSLQGRTRLNTGLSFEIDEDDYAIVHSKKLRTSYVAIARTAIKKFEADLELTLFNEGNEWIHSALPKSYLQKFKPKKPTLPVEMPCRMWLAKPA